MKFKTLALLAGSFFAVVAGVALAMVLLVDTNGGESSGLTAASVSTVPAGSNTAGVSTSRSNSPNSPKSRETGELVSKTEDVTLDHQESVASVDESGNNEGHFDDRVEQMSLDVANRMVNDIRSAGAQHGVIRSGEVGVLQQQLLDAAIADDAVLAMVLDAYRSDPGGTGASELAHVLGEIRDPRVEALGQELVQSGDRASAIKGLDLLGKLKIESEKTFELSLNTMTANPDDAELVLRAMHAMPKVPQGQTRKRDILDTFTDFAAHTDAGVRSASIFKIGEWSKSEQDIAPLMEVLTSDAIDDRISAAMAIQKSNVTSNALRDSLLSRLSDKEEVWEVRRMAADSLKRFDLEDHQFEQLKTFRAEQSGVASGLSQ